MVDFQFTTARANRETGKQSKLSVGSLVLSPRESKERKEEPAASTTAPIPKAPRPRHVLNLALSEQKMKTINHLSTAVNLDSLALIKKQREEQPVAVGYAPYPIFSRQIAQQPMVPPSKDTT
mmetsp:Transcript_24644/g.38313  ORF Transcript_24644/g.38313 Transcript_24644/m.38313 type:complete len:122 (+) Transcript_24644:1320-1685(+)